MAYHPFHRNLWRVASGIEVQNLAHCALGYGLTQGGKARIEAQAVTDHQMYARFGRVLHHTGRIGHTDRHRLFHQHVFACIQAGEDRLDVRPLRGSHNHRLDLRVGSQHRPVIAVGIAGDAVGCGRGLGGLCAPATERDKTHCGCFLGDAGVELPHTPRPDNRQGKGCEMVWHKSITRSI